MTSYSQCNQTKYNTFGRFWATAIKRFQGKASSSRCLRPSSRLIFDRAYMSNEPDLDAHPPLLKSWNPIHNAPQYINMYRAPRREMAKLGQTQQRSHMHH
eukprot:TRINITY_DN11887_c1_g4_i1.p4 TRINITY_DN11887_c1_g4~~TRINITY_DN11887_c1_g4_i1.p4  ORF type:complete len:100 (+),score=9.40 TRINITY_DN11887_c1_g4_i1:289-588(+)